MTTFENFRKGGTKDEPITPGKPKESILIDLVTSTGPERMPPKENGDRLPKEKVAVIAKWIEEGAKLDAGIDPKADLMRELRIRRSWSARTGARLKRPAGRGYRSSGERSSQRASLADWWL